MASNDTPPDAEFQRAIEGLQRNVESLLEMHKRGISDDTAWYRLMLRHLENIKNVSETIGRSLIINAVSQKILTKTAAAELWKSHPNTIDRWVKAAVAEYLTRFPDADPTRIHMFYIPDDSPDAEVARNENATIARSDEWTRNN